MGKPALGGIKISPQLALMVFQFNDSDGNLPDLCRLFSDHRINLPFISLSRKNGGARISLCVDSEDALFSRELVESDGFLKSRCEVIPRIGLFSIYPIKSSFEIFGHSLRILGQAGIRLHGLVSSVSSLAFLCDFEKLPHALTAIENQMELPRNHAPFLPEIRVKQSRIVKTD